MSFNLSLEDYQTRRYSDLAISFEDRNIPSPPYLLEVVQRTAEREYLCFRSYMATACWADCNEDGKEGHELAYETIEKMIAEVIAFLDNEKVHNLLKQLPSDYTMEQVGHDLWLTRNGHGAGFWDRGLGELGDELSELATACGSSDLYVGDDDLIYCS